MKKSEYLKIILEGYINNKDFLGEHFYREFKSAEQKHVDFIEFTTGLTEGVKVFLAEIKRLHYKDLKEFYQHEKLVDQEHADNFAAQKPQLISYSVHLPSFTNNKYIGDLGIEDLNIVSDALLKFITKYEGENSALSLQQSALTNNKDIKNKDYKNTAWFNVGILFATGEMDQLKIQFNSNATKIAKHLYNDKWETYRPCIGESLSNTNDTDKNIFQRPKKLMDIYTHCLENNIPIIDSFKALLQPE